MSEGTGKALVKPGQVKRIGGWRLLTAADKVKIRRVMAAGTPENTKRAYRGDVNAFWAWAETQGASEAYPAPFGLVLKYILHHLDQHAPATLERRISGLSVAHQLQGVPSELNPCRHSQVRALLSKIKRAAVQEGRTTRRMKAATLDYLELMIDTCHTGSLIDCRDKALLLTAWASGGRRRSEMAALRVEDQEAIPGGGFTLTIRRSKTDQEGKGLVVPVKGRAAAALKEWLEASGITEGPLFRSINKWGHLGPSITGKAVADVVKKRARMAGLNNEEFGGHSLRAGFITEGGRRRIALGDVMALSGHRSVKIAQGYYQAGDAMNNPAGEMLGMGA